MTGLTGNINRLPIKFKKESLLNTFIGLIKRFNQEYAVDKITISKKELWKIAKLGEEYDESKIRNLISELTKSDTYDVGEKHIILSGSVFVTKQNLEDGTITIYIPEPFREYIFTRRDIELMEANRKKTPLTPKDLEYWDKVVKFKKKDLVLLSEKEVLNLKSKYSKRLYSLLIQFRETGVFRMKISDFKEVIQAPIKYSFGEINKYIINKAKIELENANLFLFNKENIGKGRRIIETIDIRFKYIGELKNTSEFHIKEVEYADNKDLFNIFDSEKMKVRSSATKKYLVEVEILSKIQTEINLALNSSDLEKIKEKYSL